MRVLILIYRTWSFNEKIHTKIIEKYSIELFPNIYEADIFNELHEEKNQLMAYNPI